MTIRQASHSGSWYSDNPKRLSKQLEEWLAIAEEDSPLSDVNQYQAAAIIAPHAGYSYSGSTAAYAYRHINPKNISRVFILGPSHHFYLRGCAVTQASAYATPLGNMEIDTVLCEKLLDTGSFEKLTMDVDEEEHSLELHLPYIMKAMQGVSFKAVPILVGSTSDEDNKHYGSILAPFLSDPANLFVVSSDFCHWGSRFRYQPHDESVAIHEFIRLLDQQGMELIENQNEQEFSNYLRKTKNTICGRHPIAVLLSMIAQAGRQYEVKFVQYNQSSACTKMSDSSVSYAAAVIYRE